MKRPPERDQFDEAVLRRQDLAPREPVIDEVRSLISIEQFGVEKGVQPKFT